MAVLRRRFIGVTVVAALIVAAAYIVNKASYDEAVRDYERLTRDGGTPDAN